MGICWLARLKGTDLIAKVSNSERQSDAGQYKIFFRFFFWRRVRKRRLIVIANF
jgi:hypothetical protein